LNCYPIQLEFALYLQSCQHFALFVKNRERNKLLSENLRFSVFDIVEASCMVSSVYTCDNINVFPLDDGFLNSDTAPFIIFWQKVIFEKMKTSMLAINNIFYPIKNCCNSGGWIIRIADGLD
jgi:hypothetical protein